MITITFKSGSKLLPCLVFVAYFCWLTIPNNPKSRNSPEQKHSAARLLAIKGVKRKHFDELYLPKTLDFTFKGKSNISYLFHPGRVIGNGGLLHLRDIQGRTLSGSLMKAVFITFVNSQPHQPERRDAVRKTWASVKDLNGWKFEVVFTVLASINEIEAFPLLRIERTTYGDMLIYDWSDGGGDDHLWAAMEWASALLPGDFYVAFSEADYLLNVLEIKNFMSAQRHDTPPHNTVNVINVNGSYDMLSPVPQTIYCFGGINNGSLKREYGWVGARNTQQSFGINEAWPLHCSKKIFGTSAHMIKSLLTQPGLPAFNGIDVTLYVTGILRERLLRGDKNIVEAESGKMHLYKSYARSDLSWFSASEEERTTNYTLQWNEWMANIKFQNLVLTKYS